MEPPRLGRDYRNRVVVTRWTVGLVVLLAAALLLSLGTQLGQMYIDYLMHG